MTNALGTSLTGVAQVAPPSPSPAPLHLPADLLAALRHEDANPANWEGVFPTAYDGFDDLSDEGGLK
jgi:hypothetical protein